MRLTSSAIRAALRTGLSVSAPTVFRRRSAACVSAVDRRAIRLNRIFSFREYSLAPSAMCNTMDDADLRT